MMEDYEALWARVLRAAEAYVKTPRHLKPAALARYRNACKAAQAARPKAS
jgi:hypothetical protein